MMEMFTSRQDVLVKGLGRPSLTAERVSIKPPTCRLSNVSHKYSLPYHFPLLARHTQHSSTSHASAFSSSPIKILPTLNKQTHIHIFFFYCSASCRQPPSRERSNADSLLLFNHTFSYKFSSLLLFPALVCLRFRGLCRSFLPLPLFLPFPSLPLFSPPFLSE